MRGSSLASGAVVLSAALVTSTFGGGTFHSGDIVLTVVDGQLVTNGTEAGDNPTPIRLFLAEFGDLGCDAFTSNPGCDSAAGTFAPGTSIGWDAVSGLQFWNGTSFEATDVEFMQVSFGSQQFDIADGPAEGFSLFVQADGGFHKHVDFCMQGCPLGCSPPPDTDPGVYLVNLIVKSSDSSIADSEPYWLLFDYLAPAGAMDDALAWAESNLLANPCPADIDSSGTVDFDDLLALLTSWGDCAAPPCPADLDQSGSVDFSDLLALLAAYGDC